MNCLQLRKANVEIMTYLSYCLIIREIKIDINLTEVAGYR